METKTYDPIGTEVQTLRIKSMAMKCKLGENAEELLDKLTNLIRRFSEDGNWFFVWDIE